MKMVFEPSTVPLGVCGFAAAPPPPVSFWLKNAMMLSEVVWTHKLIYRIILSLITVVTKKLQIFREILRNYIAIFRSGPTPTQFVPIIIYMVYRQKPYIFFTATGAFSSIMLDDSSLVLNVSFESLHLIFWKNTHTIFSNLRAAF